MSTGLKFFIAYWVIGLLVVLFSLANEDIKKGFEKDFLAYVIAGLAISLLYPLMIFRGIKERSKNNNEGE